MSLPEQAVPKAAVFIDDDRLEELLALTDGAATLCYQCGVCTAVCPWSQITGRTISIRSMIRQAQLGIQRSGEDLWLCTACAHCEVYCPRGVEITRVIRGLRYLDWQNRSAPAGLPSVLWSLYWNNNPWSMPPSSRSLWAQEFELEPFDPSVHEILLYVGCTSSYDRRAQNVVKAVIALLDAAEVRYGYLGNDEPCCGEAALSVGHRPFFLEMAEKATKVFADRGVTRLVTISPHCYDVFKNHYPEFSEGTDGFEAQHYSQYLAELVDAGRLRFDKSLAQPVTVHDPCYLARNNGDSTSIRKLLKAVPGIEVIEMAHNGSDTLCCGGGGGRMFLETDPAERFADLRLQEALETQAQVVVTACPFCMACLEDSVKSLRLSDLNVLDVAEVVAEAIVVKS